MRRVPIARPVRPFRDASRFVIAVEGAVTEPTYFDEIGLLLASGRVVVEVVPGGTHSDPTAVVARAKDVALLDGDRVWVVVDVDRWAQQGKLQEAGSQAVQLRYGFAVSNPCFEIWLQLHVTEAPTGVSSKDAKAAWGRLRVQEPFTREQVRVATTRSRACVTDGFVPVPPGTTVGHLIVDLAPQLLDGPSPGPVSRRR